MINKITEEQSLGNIEKNISKELTGKKLWGDLVISLEEYETLKNHIKRLLGFSGVDLPYICKMYPDALTTFMIALIRYKYNYNFWGLMSQELGVPIYGSLESEIGSCVRNAFSRHKFDFSDVKDERRVNLEPIFYEAGLPPESSLDDLFYVLNYDLHGIFDPQVIIDDLVEMRSYQIRKPMLKFLRRFKDDRALEFVLEVHDAMLCVDQSMEGDSHYIGNYANWKERERSKEFTSSRKKQEFQTKPYLTFENGQRGLCMVLPRTVMKNEWVEDVEWLIVGNDGFELHKKLDVFGDEGRRYVDSIVVPVSPSTHYTVQLLDDENIDDFKLLEWSINGIEKNGCVFFNSNGRVINANYIPYPYGIVIMGAEATIVELKNVVFTYQSYPTDQANYKIISLEPTGRDATFSYIANGRNITLNTRPQINMYFEGRTLFSIPSDGELHVFTDIPILHIEVDEETIINGLELRISKEVLTIDQFFKDNHAVISLKTKIKADFSKYGTYSIRLYQYDHFLKQIEFSLMPQIKTSYSPYLMWPEKLYGKARRNYRFEKNPKWTLEFENCIVSNDESNYIVECLPNVGVLTVIVRCATEENAFSYRFDLPVSPFEIEILDNFGMPLEQGARKLVKLGLTDIQEKEYWIGLKFLGDYKKQTYSLQLRTVNGVEQSEKLALAQNSCGNFNISAFADTLSNCPLPAQLELCCNEDATKVVSVLLISDTVQLKQRPLYTKSGYIAVSIEDGGNDLIVTRFGLVSKKYHLPYALSKISKTKTTRGYKCPESLITGIYTVEGNKMQSNFEFEEESEVTLSNGNNTIYVSSREKNAAIGGFSDWLDQLIKDILTAGIIKDIVNFQSYIWLNQLSQLDHGDINEDDYEKLIALAYFFNAKCSNAKRKSIQICMKAISEQILDAGSRLQMIRLLADLQCPTEIFDICLKEYNLYLFLVGSDDAKLLAEKIESISIELSMLLRMGVDDSIRNTVWRDKYRDLIGREAIKILMNVPGSKDQITILEEQKKFLREQPHGQVRINITKDISGDMKPIQDMIEVTHKKIYFNKLKKPEVGVYFDHIRYIDQYVNWYSLNHDKNGEMLSEIKDMMIHVVQDYCNEVLKSISELKKLGELKDMISRYEKALQARYENNPLNNISACIPARYFYLQGMAAFLAKMPAEYRKYGWAVRAGEHFMARAMNIAPRIARRDLIMASTYIYLVRKEEKLCR